MARLWARVTCSARCSSAPLWSSSASPTAGLPACPSRANETLMVEPLDMTLDELKAALAPRLGAHAAFDGWGEAALAMAAGELGVPADRARLAFPGGAMEMIDAWFDWIDIAMLEAFPPERIATLKIRE